MHAHLNAFFQLPILNRFSAEQLTCEYASTEPKKNGFLLDWKPSLGITLHDEPGRSSQYTWRAKKFLHPNVNYFWYYLILLGNMVSHPYLDTSVNYKHYFLKIIFQAINKEKSRSPRAQMQIPNFWKQRQ